MEFQDVGSLLRQPDGLWHQNMNGVLFIADGKNDFNWNANYLSACRFGVRDFAIPGTT